MIMRVLRRNSSIEQLRIRLINIGNTMCRQSSSISCWRRKRKSFWYEILARFSFKIGIGWLLGITVVDIGAFMSLMSKRCVGLGLNLRRYCGTVYIQVLPLDGAIQFLLAILLWKALIFVIVIMSERVLMRAHILFLGLLLRERYLDWSLIILNVFVKYLNSSTKQAK